MSNYFDLLFCKTAQIRVAVLSAACDGALTADHIHLSVNPRTEAAVVVDVELLSYLSLPDISGSDTHAQRTRWPKTDASFLIARILLTL